MYVHTSMLPMTFDIVWQISRVPPEAIFRKNQPWGLILRLRIPEDAPWILSLTLTTAQLRNHY